MSAKIRWQYLSKRDVLNTFDEIVIYDSNSAIIEKV